MERSTTDLDSTINALHGGVISISPSAAVGTIDTWQNQLEASGRSDLQGIAADLGELKRHLTSGSLDGRAIGAVLSRLGSQTTAAASSADVAVQSKLQQLGQLLSRAGNALGS